ncbi:MAG: hypothetical protein GY856_35385 [bacterium]|nr:hypothetical protein [bacterium]
MRPDPDADERIIGALGRAAEYYGIDVYAFAFASSHYHLLYGARHGSRRPERAEILADGP